MKHKLTGIAALLAGIVVSLEPATASDATAPRLHAQFVTGTSPSTPRFVLTWDSSPGARYKVQSVELGGASGVVGKTIDLVMASSNRTRWVDYGVLDRSKFYRLELPQPEIFAVEPAIAVAGVETVFHVVGQCFSGSTELRVGPRALTNREVINPTLMRASFTPPTAGTYVFELVQNGQPVHTFHVYAVDEFGNSGLALQEPLDDWPTGSPFLLMPALMKAKEKANRTKCGNNLRVAGGGAGGGRISIEHSGRAQGPTPLAGSLRSKTTEAKVVLGGIKTSEESFLGMDDDCDDAEAAAVAIPAFMKNARKAKTAEAVANLRIMHGGNDCDDGDYIVQPHSAELQHRVVDMVIPGRELDFIWERTYRSRTGRDTPMGQNWDHSYNIYVEQHGDRLVLFGGNGRQDVLYPQTDGTYSADGLFLQASIVGGRVKVKFPWLGEWNFHPFDGSSIAGKIASSVARNGGALTYSWDQISGRLMAIVDDLGRTNRLGYDASGRIASLTDFTGRTVRYSYDGNGDLRSVTSPAVTGTPNSNDFPDGKTTSYSYSTGFTDERLNHNLLSERDGNSNTWLQVVYRTNQVASAGNFDAIDSVQYGPYSMYIRRAPVAPTPANGFAVVKCIINDAVGNVCELLTDARNRCVSQTDFTGRAVPNMPVTETQNRPRNKVRPCAGTLENCDPDFFVTRFSWNRDSMCTRVVYPAGNSTEFVYGRDFDKNGHPLKVADLRVVRSVSCCIDTDSDGDGVPDGDDLTTRMEYHPDYGSPAMALRPKRCHKPFRIHKEWDAATPLLYHRFANGPRQTTSMDGSFSHRALREDFEKNTENVSGGFGISLTDPMGNTTTSDYDAAGNRIQITHHGRLLDTQDKPIEGYVYNSHGQITAYIHAADANGRRRRDEFVYDSSGYLRQFTVDAQGPVVTRTMFENDLRGNVTRVHHPFGYGTEFTYNQLNQLLEVRVDSQTLPPRLRIGSMARYDANNNLVQIDHDNSDENGRIDPANPTWTTQFRYDALNRMVDCWRDKNGTVILICDQVQYDGNNNVVLYRSPQAVNGSNVNAVVRLEYDERNKPFRQIRAPGSPEQVVEQTDYTLNGRKSVQWEPHKAPGLDLPEAQRTTYAYDGFDRVVQVVDPMGNYERINYDRTVNVLRRQFFAEPNDVPGGAGNLRYHEWRWQYNSLHRVTAVEMLHFDPATQSPIDAGARVRTFSYTPNGLLWTAGDNAHETTFAYDTQHRLEREIDPLSNELRYSYDASGNLRSTTQIDRSGLASGEETFVVTYSYDSLGRRNGQRDNVGNNENWNFDSRGNIVRLTDALGNTSTAGYDGLNRTTVVAADVDRDGKLDVLRTFEWDDNSNLASETDANGNTTRYQYDEQDRQTLATSADGTVHRFVWNARGDLASSTDANGTIVSNRYDALGRVVRRDIIIPPGSVVLPTTTFEEFLYDGVSQMTRAANDASVSTFAYDSHGNTTRIIQDGYQMLKAFDSNGNERSSTYPSGLVLETTYDALYRPVAMDKRFPQGTPQGPIARLTYHGPDRLVRITRGGGLVTALAWNGMENRPNAAGDFGWKQIASVRHLPAPGGPGIYRGTNRWDAGGNLVARDNHLQGAVDVIQALRLSYDGLNRLIQSQRETNGVLEADTIYGLDANGNRRFVGSGGAVGPYVMDTTEPEPADFQMNQYTFTPFGNDFHDRNGNLIRREQPAHSTFYQYRYDYANRLVDVDDQDLHVATYRYDALGRRVGKTVGSGGPALAETTYIYDSDDDCDDGNDIVEIRGGGGAVEQILANARGLGDLTAQVGSMRLPVASFSAAGEVRYHQTDCLASAVALSDAQGRVLVYYSYDDYGQPTFLNPDGTVMIGTDGMPLREPPFGNSFLFHGMQWDSETGLYLHGSKPNKDYATDPYVETAQRWANDPYAEDASCYYDPKTGRYTTRARGIIANNGSGGVPPGRSAYTFAGNNPWSPRQEGGQNEYARKLLGGAKYSNIVLKRGFAHSIWADCGRSSRSDVVVAGSNNLSGSSTFAKSGGAGGAYGFAIWPHMHQRYAGAQFGSAGRLRWTEVKCKRGITAGCR